MGIMVFLKDLLEIIYYISFIVLTWLIVKYAIKTYNLQSSKESKLLCKIFVQKENVEKEVFPFYLEIYNFGNIVAKNIDVIVFDNKRITIDFIKPNESYYYSLGHVFQMVDCNRAYLFDDDIELGQNEIISASLKSQEKASSYNINTTILFVSRKKLKQILIRLQMR